MIIYIFLGGLEQRLESWTRRFFMISYLHSEQVRSRLGLREFLVCHVNKVCTITHGWRADKVRNLFIAR